ncbi:hypothetical protein SAPIO_CDS8385 [Scedosporium apiospermum]|uniref:MoaB/Mog domain-containing protein n=1 Tax=Pseudallescheria apiosperma TaxID=563466 RepID=A0A084FZI3_PSEDA|nr:uncharacterized protein SAPIO_CDS8385 [Scedosporium apiospermum]KEZ40495.1 hypothetical protein SAPIO_CDS8385 [Scedosporium apiospermum]
MISRLSQVARHLSTSPTSLLRTGHQASSILSRRMASADERNARAIHTAACLIIGDEVLGGKTVDTNSAYLAKWCFSLGIVIADDESEIIEAVRRMSDNYDFVVTRHDDITYQSIGKAFGLPLCLHQQAYERMRKISVPHPSQPNFNWEDDTPAKRARLRMVQLPIDEKRDVDKQVIFPHDDLWVPVTVVNGNIHILPGVPKLFQKLLDGLGPFVLPRLAGEGKGIFRVIISTPLAESLVADYLTTLAARVEPQGVKVGSYPRWGEAHNTVTLVGRDKDFLESLVAEVEENVQGKRIESEDVLDAEQKKNTADLS